MNYTLFKIPGDAWRYFCANGPLKFLYQTRKEFYRRFIGITKDRFYSGRIVELLGNRWRLNGLLFFLNNSAIETRLKSRFLLGVYEKEERILVKKYLRRDCATIEFGASIGVVSCLTNSLMEHPKQHVVVEANPHLISTLELNKKKNRCGFTVMHAALAYGAEKITFYLHDRFVGGSVQRETKNCVEVATTSLGALVKKYGFSRINLVCDAEGAELELIAKEGEVLRNHVCMAIIEVHPGIINTEDEVEHAHQQLLNLGFTEIDRQHIVRVYRNNSLL